MQVSIITATAACILLTRLRHLLVDHYAVNMPLGNQWDFQTLFFNNQTSWAGLFGTEDHDPAWPPRAAAITLPPIAPC